MSLCFCALAPGAVLAFPRSPHVFGREYLGHTAGKSICEASACTKTVPRQSRKGHAARLSNPVHRHHTYASAQVDCSCNKQVPGAHRQVRPARASKESGTPKRRTSFAAKRAAHVHAQHHPEYHGLTLQDEPCDPCSLIEQRNNCPSRVAGFQILSWKQGGHLLPKSVVTALSWSPCKFVWNKQTFKNT